MDFYEKNESIRQEAEVNLYKIGKNSTYSIPHYIDNKLKKVDNNKIIYFMGLLALALLISTFLVFQFNQRIGIYLAVAFFIVLCQTLPFIGPSPNTWLQK